MSTGDVFAHKAEVVGEYKIEIGWDHEPPIQGIENAIELVVTHANDEDKKQAEEIDDDHIDHDAMDDDHDAMDDDHDEHSHEGGVAGLEETIQVTVTLDGTTNTLSMAETNVEGIYHGKFIPESAGYPVVHLSGMIHDTELGLDMHPEEVEYLSTLPPLKQINLGIEPGNVQCKEGLELFMRIHDDSAICATNDMGQRLMSFGIVDYF